MPRGDRRMQEKAFAANPGAARKVAIFRSLKSYFTKADEQIQ